MRWLLLVCVIACGGKSTKSNEQMQKEHKAPLLGKLAALKAAADAGAGHASDPGVATVADLDFDTVSHNDKANAIAVLAVEAQDPASDPTPPLRFQGDLDDDVRVVKAFVGVQVGPHSGTKEWGWDEPMFKRFENLKYVLLVYPTHTQLPHKDSSDEFTPGEVTADAVLVELSTNKILGGFTVSAESSDEVRSQNVDGHLGADEHYQDKLDNDLGEKWGKAITDGIAKRWPGAQVPWSVGIGP
jgi:hypothetical protein